MKRLLAHLGDFFRNSLWQDEGRGPRGLYVIMALRVLVLAAQGLFRNRALISASALAYATMLALIPVLALLFAVWKGLGLQRLLAANLLERLAPGSHEFVTQIIMYIETTQVASLGVFGVVALLAILVLVMTNVERAFNETWHVSQTRPWERKISDYFSIFLIFPILMAGTISVSSTFLTHPELQRLMTGVFPATFYTFTSGLVQLGLLWLGFTFIYLVMPNTQVRFGSAFLGAIVGGSLWQGAQWIFIWFQGMATYYNAIYGALYNLLFLFIWMFWSWLIVLYGTEVAYAHQNYERIMREVRRGPLKAEPVDEYLALAALINISGRFLNRQPPLSLEELSRVLPSGNNLAIRVINSLKNCALVVQVVSKKASPQFIPSLPLDQVTVQEVLQGLRQARGASLAQALAEEPHLAALLQRLLEAPVPSEWQSLSLQELVRLLEEESVTEQA